MSAPFNPVRRRGCFWHAVGLFAMVLRNAAVRMGRGKQLRPTTPRKRKRRSGTLTGFFDMP